MPMTVQVTAEPVPTDWVPRTFADVEVLLRERRPGYQARPGQQKLAAAIELLMRQQPDPERGRPPMHLFAEGPCGVGKALAGLVPAILSNQRVIYSVHTKALQDQIALGELPMLVKILEPYLGEIRWTVLKGRSAYWCQAQAAKSSVVLDTLPGIRAYAEENSGWDGTRETLPFDVPPEQWREMCSDSEGCNDPRCMAEDPCYAAKARAYASTCRIVLANHALVCTDAVIKRDSNSREAGMLGVYDKLVLDEGHTFADVATECLTSEIAASTFSFLARDAVAWAARYGAPDPDLSETLQRYSERVRYAGIDLFGPDGVSKGRIRELGERLGDLAIEALDSVVALGRAIRSSYGWVKESANPKARKAWTALFNRAKALGRRLADLTSKDPDLVRQVVEDKRGLVIKICPLYAAPFLREHLFAHTPTLILSATLSVSGKFSFVARQLGCDRFAGISADSPFDYLNQARVMVLPVNPQSGEPWDDALREFLVEAAPVVGRTLVLDSSSKHLGDTARWYREQGQGVPLLVQYEAGVAELAEEFRRAERAVLFGSKSFMTGFDAPGNKLVVIPRITFDSPEDAIPQARCERIEEEGGDPFHSYSVPAMLLTLRQAIGRGVRTVTDRVVIVIADERVDTKGYGRQIWRNIPQMPRVGSVEDIRRFLVSG